MALRGQWLDTGPDGFLSNLTTTTAEPLPVMTGMLMLVIHLLESQHFQLHSVTPPLENRIDFVVTLGV